MPPYTLYHADCFDILPTIPDKSVDMVLCDLPYGVLNKSNPHTRWDCVLDLDALWAQYRRICKGNAAIVLFGSGMFTAKLMMSNPKMWRYNLVWDKCRTTGFLNARRMPLRRHEDIAVFYDKLPTYNPQMHKCPPHLRNHTRDRQLYQTNRCYGSFGKAEDIISDEKYPTSIIVQSQGHAEQYHPTEKPVELLRYLIRTYSDEGGVILDNTMGSGSTGVAALLEHRRFIGIEKEKEYFDIATKRIEKVYSQTQSTLPLD